MSNYNIYIYNIYTYVKILNKSYYILLLIQVLQ